MIRCSSIGWLGHLQTNKFEVLILDDEIQVLAALKRSLDKKYSVHACSQISEVLETLHETSIPVAIFDQNLKDRIDGIEFAELIKDNYPAMRIILLTGDHSTELVIEALNSGAIDGFLTKPFNHKELFNLIDENFKLYTNQKKTVDETMQQIQSGKTVQSSQLDKLGSKIEILEDLIYDNFKIERGKTRVKIIGLSIFRKQTVIYQEFIESEIEVRNEKMLIGFIKTISSLSRELFSNISHDIEEISLNGVSLIVKKRSHYKVILYVVSKDTAVSQVDNDFTRFLDKLDGVIPRDTLVLRTRTKEKILTEVEILNTHLA